ncbi:unnamed protein product [Polarella glacialis]|uniref:Uncharacterized protein n=1 Tax=Polarella glacialis TaxID=89957 RepID=A0A813IA17_POLGL|nr:unnamed protein product [Polarella glacialis]
MWISTSKSRARAPFRREPQNCHAEGLRATWSALGGVGEVTVEAISQSEARIVVDRPLRYARLCFRGSFGGAFGLAVRKVSFYGYEVRSVPLDIDLAQSKFRHGCKLHSHNDMLNPKEVDAMVHRSLHPFLRAGRRMESSTLRWKVYQDICSGAPHVTTSVQTPRLKLPKDVTIIGAILGLRYLSKMTTAGAQPPRMKVQLLHHLGKEEAAVPKGGEPLDEEAQNAQDEIDAQNTEKMVLFRTEDLIAGEWGPGEILGKGYLDHRMLFTSGLDFSSDQGLSLEVLFQNHAGTMYIPGDLGLTLYYVPELGTPSDDEDDGELAEKSEAGATTTAAAATTTTQNNNNNNNNNKNNNNNNNNKNNNNNNNNNNNKNNKNNNSNSNSAATTTGRGGCCGGRRQE